MPKLQRMKVDIVDWIENAGRSADSHTIAFPHPGTGTRIYGMKEHVSEFDGSCSRRRFKSGLVAEQFARIGVKDTGGGLIRM